MHVIRNFLTVKNMIMMNRTIVKNLVNNTHAQQLKKEIEQLDHNPTECTITLK